MVESLAGRYCHEPVHAFENSVKWWETSDIFLSLFKTLWLCISSHLEKLWMCSEPYKKRQHHDTVQFAELSYLFTNKNWLSELWRLIFTRCNVSQSSVLHKKSLYYILELQGPWSVVCEMMGYYLVTPLPTKCLQVWDKPHQWRLHAKEPSPSVLPGWKRENSESTLYGITENKFSHMWIWEFDQVWVWVGIMWIEEWVMSKFSSKKAALLIGLYRMIEFYQI
jgi:hypothetical protein